MPRAVLSAHGISSLGSTKAPLAAMHESQQQPPMRLTCELLDLWAPERSHEEAGLDLVLDQRRCHDLHQYTSTLLNEGHAKKSIGRGNV